jgi:hypothetical protein
MHASLRGYWSCKDRNANDDQQIIMQRCYFDLPRGLGNESGEALDLPHHYRKVRSKCRNRWMNTSFRCVGYEFRLAKREEELVNALPVRDRSHSRC